MFIICFGIPYYLTSRGQNKQTNKKTQYVHSHCVLASLFNTYVSVTDLDEVLIQRYFR